MPVPARRRHTLAFLKGIRSAYPVHLSTKINVSKLVAHRTQAERRYSYVAYVIAALGSTLVAHPEANVAFGGLWMRPRIRSFDSVDVKLALDKTDDGVRHVASAVIPRVESLSIDTIQDEVDRLRDTPAADLGDLAGSRVLDRFPPLLGRYLFTLATRLSRRSQVLGTIALSSLGHAEVDAFYANGGTAVSIGVGSVVPTPFCVPDGTGGYEVQVGQLMTVSLTFDHRAMDGALAADVLSTLANLLRNGDFS